MLVSVLAVGLVAVLTLTLLQRHAQQQEISYLTANAQVIARQALAYLWPRPSVYGLRRLAQTSAFVGNVRVRVLDANRKELADSGPRESVDEFVWVLPPEQAEGLNVDNASEPQIMSLLLSRLQSFAARSPNKLPPGSTYVVVRRIDDPWGSRFVFETYERGQRPKDGLDPVDGPPRSDRTVVYAIGDSTRPIGYIELSGAPNFGGETLATTARAFLLAGLVATMVAGLVGLLVSRSLTSPLNALTAATGRMSGGDLTARARITRRDEIGQLAGQFNRMAEQLQRSFAELETERDALRRFVGDASHELRTPITALKMYNELLLGPAQDDFAARQEFLTESQRQVDRLEWITGNLLDLSRLDAGLTQLDLAQHDMSDIVRAAIAPFRLKADEKGVQLTTSLPSTPVQTKCDRARMELAITNLVDNALKFTPPGGHIEVGAESREREIVVWVRDDGPGIDSQDQPHIFERFYRGHGPRADGNGLGLAIVKSVAQAHGGQVRVESAVGAGSRFEVELPL